MAEMGEAGSNRMTWNEDKGVPQPIRIAGRSIGLKSEREKRSFVAEGEDMMAAEAE